MIAAEVRRQRQKYGMEQLDLAQRADIPQGTLSRIENGRATIDPEQMKRIAAVFGMLPEVMWAIARTRTNPELGDPDLYLPDGSLNPEVVRGVAPDEETLTWLASRKRFGSSN